MATRLDPASGIVRIDNAFGHGLNPSFPDYVGPKVGFDATQPFPKRAEYERVAFKAVAVEAHDIAGIEGKPDLAAAVRPAAPAQRSAPPPAGAAPVRPTGSSSDYDTNRIWERELAAWKKDRGAREEAPAPAARPAATSDWDENRWWKRELEEMKRERGGRKAGPAMPAKPAPARPALPPRTPVARPAPVRASEPRRLDARGADDRVGDGRSDDDDGGFFRGGAV
jgi:3-polyprenyl-4-hydroxybenzoate decarboxylase